MSERTFRAVVAAVLVGALALAVVVATVALVPPSPRPSPRPSPGPSSRPSLASTPIATPTASESPTSGAGPVFEAPDVVSVGLIARGSASASTLQMAFIEPRPNAIPGAPGSFRVVLTDHAGDGSTVAFVGTPSVVAPGSLGATAEIIAPNVILVRIVASDSVNVELLTIKDLGIRTTSRAALGSLIADLEVLTGSLATGAARNVLPSPGTVVGNL